MNHAGEATCTRCGQPASAHAGTQREIAERAMTARWDSGVCPRCGLTIRRGDRIGLISGGWAHIDCITGRTPYGVRWPGAA